MMNTLFSRLLGLDARSVVESWTLRFRSDWPLFLLALGVLAALVGAFFLYRRETVLGRVGRILMMLARTLGVAVVLVMLFRPTAEVRIRQTVKPTALLLVDDSASMDIRDTRKEVAPLTDAAMALGKLPYDSPDLSRAVVRSRRAMEAAAVALESGKADPAREALAAVTEALADVRRAAENRSPDVAASLMAAFDELAARQATLAGDQQAADADLGALAGGQRSLSIDLFQWKEQAVNSGLSVSEKLAAEVASVPRRELVQQSLQVASRSFLQDLSRQADVRVFRFAGQLEASVTPWDQTGSAAEPPPQGMSATRLGSAINEALARNEGQPIGLVAVVTDGANNGGADPVEAARELRRRDIPLVTVSVGLTKPDDATLRSLVVPGVVFADDLVTARIQCRANGYERRSTPLVIRLDGVEVARQTIAFTGQNQFAEVPFKAGRSRGASLLEVELTPLPGEATLENNTLRQSLRVLDDKIKVLYVEGSPRWEFRYLRGVLKRDPRIDVQFVTTEGDKELARAGSEHLARFPDRAEEALKYDLLILGDVRANTFTPTQFGFIDQLVRERGGSLIMLAGQKYTPGEYLDTPLAAMLPVRFEQEPWAEIGDDVYPALTPAGRQSSVMTLDPLESRNQALWANVKPLFKIPPLVGAKPGAVVLAELSDRGSESRTFPLIAWHRYGAGKCMFVGVDQLWRLRARTGDTYHLKFWGQAVQFLTLSRLLGENRLVRLETGRDHYANGETVELHASVLDATYEPLASPTYQAYVTRVDGGDAVPVTLKSLPGMTGMYNGLYTPTAPGRYRFSSTPTVEETASAVRASDKAAVTEFIVEDKSVEQIETGMQQGLLAQMAAVAGGDALTLRELPLLADPLRERTQQVTFTRDIDLWDNWLPVGLFVAFVAAEWAWRRNKNLA
jgi:hypothetical protein